MIDLILESHGDRNYVRSIDENGIKIREKYYRGSLLITPDDIQPGWPPASMDELREDHLAAIFEYAPEVALLGTGPDHALLAPELQMAAYRAGIGLEVMSTPAACRTFNVLVSDDRRVVAALMPC